MNKKIKYINKVKRPLVGPCPCAIGHVSCNYIVISHILGCPYDCSYCFLHTFYGRDEVVIYDNDEELLNQVWQYMQSAEQPLRIGTGQYSDSLALDQETGMSRKLIELFSRQEKHLLELKTKSANVDHLLGLDHKGKTIFAWSVNPEKIAESDELGAVGLKDRIFAAKKCTEAGFTVAFHFDPIIFYEGWKQDYREVLDLIFTEIDTKDIAWISLGALRYRPGLKEIVEKRFANSRIKFAESELGEDGKERYFKPMRIDILKTMHEFIRFYSKSVCVYLCMETEEIWQKAEIKNVPENRYTKYFKFFEKS
jgi:spore photoproduct lyase